jgi:hypothetical protein
VLAALVVGFGARAQAPQYEVQQYRLEGKTFVPAWIVCDNHTSASMVIVSKAPNNSVRIESFAKSAPSVRRVAIYRLGRAEGAAGSVYYGLEVPGARQSQYFLRFINVEMTAGELTKTAVVNAPGLPNINCDGVNIGSGFFAVTARREVRVNGSDRDGFVYTAFDHRNGPGANPTLTLSNGTAARTGSGATYTFTNGAYTYRVSVASRPPSARIDVLRNGRLLQSETPLAFVDVRQR